MRTHATNSRRKGRLKISDAGPRVGSCKLAPRPSAAPSRSLCFQHCCLLPNRPAHAQTETVIYNFTGGARRRPIPSPASPPTVKATSMGRPTTRGDFGTWNRI